MKKSVNTVCCNAEGKYLLQMRDNHPTICNPLKWGFFGGRLEKGEDSVNGVCRELSEEIGISARADEFILLGETEYDEDIVYFFKYRPVVEWKNIVIKEGAGGGFFTKEEILKIDSTEQTKFLTQKFL